MLELDRVGFAHQPGRWLFRAVSLSVLPGEVTAVLGPNGRGKTTLLRCAAGLLEPLEGAVRRHRPAGYVPQAAGVGFGFTVFDMVLMGRARHISAYATPSRRDRTEAAAALDRVGLTGLAERPVTQLSGGERQLVLIARALAGAEGLLILDEPASALDLRNQARVLGLLGELAGAGMGVLLTTHHPDHALHLADRVVLMFGPEDVRSGPAATMLSDEHLTRLYGVPVRTVGYQDGDTPQRVVATRFR